jgi:hypothetical protein
MLTTPQGMVINPTERMLVSHAPVSAPPIVHHCATMRRSCSRTRPGRCIMPPTLQHPRTAGLDGGTCQHGHEANHFSSSLRRRETERRDCVPAAHVPSGRVAFPKRQALRRGCWACQPEEAATGAAACARPFAEELPQRSVARC